MKKGWYLFLAVLLVASLLAGSGMLPTAASAEMPPIAEEENDYIPNQVDLYFPANPTTGYSWIAEAEDPETVSIRDQYFEDSHDLGFVGAGGTHWFHIKGLKPGTTSVSFRYVRSWEPDEAAESTLYRLTVNEQLDVLIWGVEVG